MHSKGANDAHEFPSNTRRKAIDMQMNVHAAKSQLSKLIAAAEAGEDVVIARKGRPAVRLVPIRNTGFEFDTLRHLVTEAPDFDEPMSEDELALWEGGS